jgi:hypothetical protein
MIDPAAFKDEKSPASMKMRRPFEAEILLATQMHDEETGLTWLVSDIINSGGMAHIYRLVPYDKDWNVARRDGRPIPHRAMKVSQDLCDEHNDQIIDTSALLADFSQDEVASIPMIYEWGSLTHDRLEGRTPAYMIEEELYPNPLDFLRDHQLIGLDEGIHPNIAMLMTKDMLEYAIALESHGLGNYDTHINQFLIRQSPLPQKRIPRRDKYTYRLDNLHFENVLADNDMIVELGKPITHPCFTIGYGDPWFMDLDTFRFVPTPLTISYQIMATAYTLFTGKRILHREREPSHYTKEQRLTWWKDIVERRPVPTINTGGVEPLFTKEDIYQAVYPTVGVKYPTRQLRKKTFAEKLLGREPPREALSADQDTVEKIITMLSNGLKPPGGRKTPTELHQYITENFETKKDTYMIYNPRNGKYGSTTRMVPKPFFNNPSYHQRSESGRHGRLNGF